MSSKVTITELWKKRVIRFIAVGIINTATDATILNGLVFASHMNPIAANCISASISIILSYFWNHFIVFQNEHPMTLHLFLKFVIVTGLSIIIIQEAVIYTLQHIFTLNEIAKLVDINGTKAKVLQVDGAKLVAVAVGMVWNFVLYQLVVFKKSENGEDIDEEAVVPY